MTSLAENFRKRQVAILITALILTGLIFFLLRWYQQKLKVSATTSVYRINLPKEIKKSDLSSLTEEQKKLIDKHIADFLSKATKNREQTREVLRPIAVILTQNNQPIVFNQEPSPIVSTSPTTSTTTLTSTPPETPLSP